MDVKYHGGFLYAIQRQCDRHSGRLCVLRRDFSIVASYEGIGNARQIEIVGNTAVITARESGIWIFDISKATPALRCHYQTVEYATGVALYGNLAFISCRQYGVQILDISSPEKPIHIGLIRVGEVQSATVSNGILYCGVWGKMKVVVVDVKDISQPSILCEIPLQGRGDGVCVHNNVLYAATGQHARGIQNVVDPKDPHYGMGNGVEAFDVSDPAHPRKILGTTFERAFCGAVDMWEAAIYGDTLVVNNSILGVYGLSTDTMNVKFNFRPPHIEPYDAVTGVTVFDGDLFVASSNGDLFAARGVGLLEQVPNRDDVRIEASPCALCYSGSGAAVCSVYHTDAPIFVIAETDSTIALACANEGVHLLDKQTLALLAIIPTKGLAQDVKFSKNRLYVSEEMQGVEIFELRRDQFQKIGGFKADKPIYQLMPSRNGKHLMCSLSSEEVRMYDVQNAKEVKELYGYRTARGPLYGHNFASEYLQDGSMVLFCHRDGLIYTNPDKGDDRFHCIEYIKKEGFCAYCAGEGIAVREDQILYAFGGGCFLLSTTDTNKTLIDDQTHCRAQQSFSGLLTLQGNIMVATNRPKGEIYLVDIQNIRIPRIIAALNTCASPAKAIFINGRIFIPAGIAGLLELKKD